MKLNATMECTPEEARRFLGLPDVSRANDIYVDALANAMQGGSFEGMQELVKQIAPMGQLGMKMFQQLMESGTSMASMGGASTRKDDH